MKAAKIAEALSRGFDGDLRLWEDCPARAGDGCPVRRLDVGSGFTVGHVPPSGMVLYHDDGFSLTMDVCSYDGGVFLGAASEAVFDSLGARRTHVELDSGELRRFMRLTFLEDPSVVGEGSMFLISDELGIDVREVQGCPTRFLCSVSFASSDGNALFTGEGEAVYLPEGPAVVGEGFSVVIPMDLMTLRGFRERIYDPSQDTRTYLEANGFRGRPEAASARRAQLASALARARPGSRTMRPSRETDEGDEPWEG